MDSFLARHLTILEPETAQRRIKLKLDLACPGLQVQADEEQLWQALLNLIRNAMEAMPQGGQLNVVTRESGDYLECRVEDMGPGIPEDVRAKIFQPFFSTKLGGTGLGLPLTQQIFNNTLHQFTEAGLLREVIVDGSRTHFDTNTSNHHHFLFEDGSLMDIPAGALEVIGMPAAPDGTTVLRVDVLVRVGRVGG